MAALLLWIGVLMSTVEELPKYGHPKWQDDHKVMPLMLDAAECRRSGKLCLGGEALHGSLIIEDDELVGEIARGIAAGAFKRLGASSRLTP